MRFIGSKVLLLEQIKNVIDENVVEAESFCDIFSGTAAVARYFKEWYAVTSNDLLYFSYVLQQATIHNNQGLKFEGLKENLGIEDPIAYLNNSETSEYEEINIQKCFFYNNYSPAGGRMYITEENALRIDYFRITVELWKEKGLITANEYYYLVACIVEGIPFVSNISGTYGAFHKQWDKRSFKRYELFKLDYVCNNKINRCFNRDGNELIRDISGDILYIDPPYNGRQYLPNYHLLETAAKYDYPEIKGITGLRVQNAARSLYCIKKEVLNSFEDLVRNANFKHIILSYNTEGLMSVEDITSTMKAIGKENTFKLYEVPYRRFKSRNTKFNEELKELLFYIQK